MKSILIGLTLCVSSVVNAQTVDNWLSSNVPVKNSSGECWRNSSWTPATAHLNCDGAVQSTTSKVEIKSEQKVQRRVEVSIPDIIVPQKPPVEIRKMTYTADTLFDFDKSVLKPDGKKLLDNLYVEIKNLNIEFIIATGHTDSVGTEDYNKKLGLRRAKSVESYLVSRGIKQELIKIQSEGESKPVASNKTREGRAKNRRVEIQIVGTGSSK